MESSNIKKFTLEKTNAQNIISNTNIGISLQCSTENEQTLDDNYQADLDLLIKLIGNDENNNLLFKLDLLICGKFTCNTSEKSYEEFTEMLSINGTSTLIQLSRAYITSMTALSGFDKPINIPMINVYDLINHMNNNTTEDF